MQARISRNPQIGTSIQIKTSKLAAFKAGKALKEAVN
jgi:DNA-binding protein HU-beta